MSPEKSKLGNEQSRSKLLTPGSKISLSPNSQSLVRDSSLGPNATFEKEDPTPGSSTSYYQSENTADDLRSTSPPVLNNPEALSLLQSIATDVKTQGEILTAFIASQHEFRKQVCNEMSGIKKLLEIDNARFVT